MDATPLFDLFPMLTVVGSAGAAWGGALVAINGAKSRVAKLEEHQNDVRDRLARVETKLDILIEGRFNGPAK